MKRKLLLLNPIDHSQPGLTLDRSTRFQPLGLGIVAALTPDHWDVELIDENWETFQYRDADLVGITAFTSTVTRAYELAGIYKDKGIPVVMGGIHPTMCPDEALKYCDSVFKGEAENLWKQVLEDSEKGRLQKIYNGSIVNDLSKVPLPRRDLFHSKHLLASVQTSRGCPMNCEFCSVPLFNGHGHRQRPVEHILEEIKQIPQKMLFFTDDNLIGYSKKSAQQAVSLFKKMVEQKLNKWWFCQASLNIADDDEVLYWARKAGCKLVFIGIEAIEGEGLKEVNKNLNLKRFAEYKQVFAKIHKAGIAVWGAFIVGMDSDNEEKLRQREEFVIKAGLDVTQVTALTPLPGTRLFKRLQEEGRLIYTDFPKDWRLYNFDKMTFQPRNMSIPEVTAAEERIHKRMSSYPMMFRRALKTLRYTRSLPVALYALKFNISYRKVIDKMYPKGAAHPPS